MIKDGPISWVEIGCGDAEKTSAFFTEVFGWRFTPMRDGGGVFDTGAGQFGLHGDDPNPAMTPYLRVDDIDAAVSRIRALGGVAEDIVTADGFGRFSNCQDPQGTRFGLHQPE